MVRFDKGDPILSNIVAIAEKHARHSLDISISIDTSLGEYTGKYENGSISAGSYSELLNTIGKYIRHPDMKEGTFVSKKELCGLYFPTHNGNYYDAAPLEEIYEDIEDLALWGANVIALWFDMFFYENIKDGATASERLKKILLYAKSIGLKTSLMMLANEAFKSSPAELRADWTAGHDGYVRNLVDHYHVEICPSLDGGIEKILEYRRAFLENFREVMPDYVCISPYDEGGCTCTACAPWGGAGFVRCIEALTPLIKEYWPKTKIIISTWRFSSFRGSDEEFVLLNEAINKGKIDCEYIMSEPGGRLRYPFLNNMARKLVGFPEISMCGIFPWGGYGSNPLPKFLQDSWDRFGDRLEGGTPYCEGFYEDINKVMMLRLYRDNQKTFDTVREYLAYEFSLTGNMLEKACLAISCMEETLLRDWQPGHRYEILHPEKILKIEELIDEVDASLDEKTKSSKRWRAIYLRAKIDAELCRNDFVRNESVLRHFEEIIKLYHLENAGFHVKPDVINDTSYGRPLTRKELQIIAAGGRLE